MKPRILITIGDYNGVGPEIIIKALNTRHLITNNEITVITPPGVLEYYSKLLNIPLKGPFDMLLMDEEADIKPGEQNEKAGKISGHAIENAIKLCMDFEYDALVTAPISKKALNMGGYKFDGHTEMLAELTRSKDNVMFMYSTVLKIAFATTHPPIKDINKKLNAQMLISKLDICCRALDEDFGISNPKIAILGLNPHAGDNGQIGDEESKIIIPAMEEIRKLKRNVKFDGPFPADGYFGTKKYKEYDMTFAMYHDQGFIPFKILAGFNGVNCTIGMPFIRTSPDHGTAFNIAGKGIADASSMMEAISAASLIHQNRTKYKR